MKRNKITCIVVFLLANSCLSRVILEEVRPLRARLFLNNLHKSDDQTSRRQTSDSLSQALSDEEVATGHFKTDENQKEKNVLLSRMLPLSGHAKQEYQDRNQALEQNIDALENDVNVASTLVPENTDKKLSAEPLLINLPTVNNEKLEIAQSEGRTEPNINLLQENKILSTTPAESQVALAESDFTSTMTIITETTSTSRSNPNYEMMHQLLLMRASELAAAKLNNEKTSIASEATEAAPKSSDPELSISILNSNVNLVGHSDIQAKSELLEVPHQANQATKTHSIIEIVEKTIVQKMDEDEISESRKPVLGQVGYVEVPAVTQISSDQSVPILVGQVQHIPLNEVKAVQEKEERADVVSVTDSRLKPEINENRAIEVVQKVADQVAPIFETELQKNIEVLAIPASNTEKIVQDRNSKSNVFALDGAKDLRQKPASKIENSYSRIKDGECSATNENLNEGYSKVIVIKLFLDDKVASFS